jgi:nucleoid-associated protein YgaU
MASLEELKAKYNAVLDKGHEVGLTVQNLNLEGEQLLIRGVVPSDYAKNELWDAIKSVDASASDLIADFSVQSDLTYTVKSGDSLSKIAKRFYGDMNHYKAIASHNGIANPDRIDVGQEIKLP